MALVSTILAACLSSMVVDNSAIHKNVQFMRTAWQFREQLIGNGSIGEVWISFSGLHAVWKSRSVAKSYWYCCSHQVTANQHSHEKLRWCISQIPFLAHFTDVLTRISRFARNFDYPEDPAASVLGSVCNPDKRVYPNIVYEILLTEHHGLIR